MFLRDDGESVNDPKAASNREVNSSGEPRTEKSCHSALRGDAAVFNGIVGEGAASVETGVCVKEVGEKDKPEDIDIVVEKPVTQKRTVKLPNQLD